MAFTHKRGVSRRTALRSLGVGAATTGMLAAGWTAGASPARGATRSSGTANFTVREWIAQRGSRYYIAHRGSGDVLPEHSMEAYQAAVEWGAQCLEISVGLTSDGALICMHDSAYDRTTNLTGRLVDQPSSVLEVGRVWQPHLGDHWTRFAPRIPRFEDVLRTFGGRVVLAIEAKNNLAFDPMMAMVEKYGLRESVIVKSFYSSPKWPIAKSDGYPVFVYFGSTSEMTVDAVTRVGNWLNASTDCLVIPGFQTNGQYLPNYLLASAMRTGVPVWVHPLHRRCDAQRFFDHGVQGAICSSYGYVVGSIGRQSSDTWASQKIAAGEMSRNPATGYFAPSLTSAGEMVLATQGSQHFITLGQVGPLSGTAIDYSLTVDAGWKELPRSPTDNLSIAFGRVDDSYYQHRQGWGDGYHAILRASGELGLYRHSDGRIDGHKLASVTTPALRTGEYATLRVDVGGSVITLSRLDTGATISAADRSVRGDYVHVGRSSLDGVGSFRQLTMV